MSWRERYGEREGKAGWWVGEPLEKKWEEAARQDWQVG